MTSAIVSTFHEFGASAGAAAVSSAAAASIASHTVATSAAGFDHAFLTATAIAAVSAVVALWLIPSTNE